MSAPNARDNPHGILDSDMPVLRTVALVPDKEALIGVLDDQQRRVQAQAASRHLKPNQIYSLGDGAFGVLSSPWPGLPRSVPAKRGADLNPDNEPAPASKKRASGNGPQAIGSAPTRQHSQVAEQGTLSINDDDQSRGSEIDTPERQHKINFLSEKIDVLSEKVKVLSEMIDVLSQTVKALSEKEAILSEKTQVFQDPGHRVLKEDLYFRAAQCKSGYLGSLSFIPCAMATRLTFIVSAVDRNLDSEMYSISLQA